MKRGWRNGLAFAYGYWCETAGRLMDVVYEGTVGELNTGVFASIVWRQKALVCR